jgi:NAD(P)-dependent dehydrogenase (short-subunit alcohol dehydrogenase family)
MAVRLIPRGDAREPCGVNRAGHLEKMCWFGVAETVGEALKCITTSDLGAFSMSSKSVLVTGGCSGIGLALCQQFLAADYRLGIIDTATLPELLVPAEEQGRIIFVQAAAQDEKAAESLVSGCLKAWGRLDALMNNVGVFRRIPLEEMSLSDWREILDINLSSHFLFAKLCAPALRATQGSIVNIASTRALQSEPHTEAYAASKGGIVALTHALAMSLAPFVRVHCISPGWIDSRPAASKIAQPLSTADHEQHPAGRVGEPEDIAKLALWLSEQQGGFITGQNFVVDGGLTRKMMYVE